MNWFSEAFGGLADIQRFTLVIMIAAIGAGIAGYVFYRKKAKQQGKITKSQWTTKEITTAALCIGISFLLSFIKIFSMPNGGSITPASMLPIMAFAYIYGAKKGLLVGLVYSILQFIQEPYVLAPMQVVLDYPLSFMLLGLAGLARKSIVPGIAYGCAARFVCQFLSGWIFFGSYAPEGMPGWLYSLGYNGSVVGVECAICIAVSMIPALYKMLNREKAHARAHRTALNLEPTVQKTA